MPAPTAEQLEPIAMGALQSANLKGEYAGNVERAIAKTIAESLNLFLSQTQVLPGIPAAAPPPAGAGSTVGPGLLLPPPAGGPSASQIESIAMLALFNEALRGDAHAALAKVLGGVIEKSFNLFTVQVAVMPGIPIAGFVTTGPGRLG